MVWYGMVWYGMVCMVWYGMVWYGMVWYGMVWYVWYGRVGYGSCGCEEARQPVGGCLFDCRSDKCALLSCLTTFLKFYEQLYVNY
jgi:hypothetical protein